ncbi:hypothetical protein C8J56DRAFT_1045112 [Mycena floridula]|nr:hypothetical protein C8J56DRAFT_1045112 [Mycena floridula]
MNSRPFSPNLKILRDLPLNLDPLASNNATAGAFDQQMLCDRLQILKRCEYADLELTCRYRKLVPDPRDKVSIHLLNTLAVCLTTGQPGDDIAVALDKRHSPPTLILAKNELPREVDHGALRDLATILTSPETNSYREVFPFILSHCWQNLQRRVDKLFQALDEDDFTPDNYSYSWETVTSEVPNHHCIPLIDRPAQTSNQNHHQGLIEGIKRACQASLDPADIARSLDNYDHLFKLSATFVKYHFLKGEKGVMKDESTSMAQRLKRRLLKVMQYRDGVNDLVKATKRLFPTGQIPARWVSIPPPDPVNSSHSSYQEVLRHAGCDFDNPALGQIEARFPSMTGWQTLYRPQIHGEIAIVLFFHREGYFPEPEQQEPIGCSKRTCLGCCYWFQQYNLNYQTTWTTSAPGGRPCENWAIPPDRFAAPIFRRIEGLVKDRFRWLEPSRKVCDEEEIKRFKPRRKRWGG